MSDFDYSNGACGECQQCGAETAEEWHAYCSDCYAEQNGYRRPARPVAVPSMLPPQSDESVARSIMYLRDQVVVLTRIVAGFAARLETLERERAS